MRFPSVVITIAICFIASISRAQSTNNPINGTWIPISQTMNGKTFPAMVYASQKLIIDDSNYTVIAESIDRGVIIYTANKMDIYGKDGVNKGKHFTAIYKYEDKQLTICYNLLGDSYPELFDSKGKGLLFLSVFKKEGK